MAAVVGRAVVVLAAAAAVGVRAVLVETAVLVLLVAAVMVEVAIGQQQQQPRRGLAHTHRPRRTLVACCGKPHTSSWVARRTSLRRTCSSSDGTAWPPYVPCCQVAAQAVVRVAVQDHRPSCRALLPATPQRWSGRGAQPLRLAHHQLHVRGEQVWAKCFPMETEAAEVTTTMPLLSETRKLRAQVLERLAVCVRVCTVCSLPHSAHHSLMHSYATLASCNGLFTESRNRHTVHLPLPC